MNFLENIFSRLQAAPDRVVLGEAHVGGMTASGEAASQKTATGSELLAQIAVARAYLRAAGLAKGDRCALIAPNSIRWAALDLAIMAEGMIAVPLYARQAPAELVAMLRDAEPGLICCGDAACAMRLRPLGRVRRALCCSRTFLMLPRNHASNDFPAPAALAPQDTVAILYTSGTSGEAKGVMLTAANLDHMLSCTGARLDQLMGARETPDRVFHYLPFCFAGSWILLLSCLSRNQRSHLVHGPHQTRRGDRRCGAELFPERADASGADSRGASKETSASAAG